MNEYMKKVITEKGWNITTNNNGTVTIYQCVGPLTVTVNSKDSLYEVAKAVLAESMKQPDIEALSGLATAVSPWCSEGKKVCPICGSHEFLVTAHVTQDWVVNGDGDFLACTDECTEVTHKPNDEDIWVCSVCGHDGSGEDFNPKS